MFRGLKDDPTLIEYIGKDYESYWLWDTFAEKPCKVLEIGANDEDISYILSNNGFNVTSIDLYPFNREKKPKFKFIQGDFCEYNFKEKFDIIISISAIEHFGIQYRAGKPDYDIQAMDKIWDLLNDLGVAYISVPIDSEYAVNAYYRMYDEVKLKERIIRNFTIVSQDFFLADTPSWGDEQREYGKYYTKNKAFTFHSGWAGMAVGLKLKKVI